MPWFELLKEWKFLLMGGIVLVCVTAFGVQRLEISHLQDELSTCQADYKGLSDKVNKQNVGIKQQGADYNTMKQKIAAADQTNSGLQDQLNTALDQLKKAKVPPTCRGSLDWLKAQAPFSPAW